MISAKRWAALAAVTAVLSGCAQTTPGQVALTTEPMSPDITCADYLLLSDRDRFDFTREILDSDNTAMGQPVILSAVAMVLCQRTPDTPVRDILMRLRP